MPAVNPLDKLVAWVSPKAGAARLAWRQIWEQSRNYDAGGYQRPNTNWYAVNQAAESTDRPDRDLIRARARDLERNSDLMNSVISAFVRNVVGGGFILQAETGDDTLNGQIETLWKTWCKKRNCDITGTQSLDQMLRMAVRRKKIDGGILFAKRFTKAGIIPFQLQLFEVDELDASQVAPKYKGNRVVGGVEYNSFQKPVGYWIRQYSLDGFQAMDSIFLHADDVIFYFSKRRPSQLREMSDLSQTITRVRDANEYMTAVSVLQRIAACFGLAIKKVNPDGQNWVAGRQGISPTQSYEEKSIHPGMIWVLSPGDSVETINPQGQATDATTFLKLMQGLIGAGQGVSYEAVSRDMSQTNYSSARQAIIEDGMTFAEESELLGAVLDEIYETFLISSVLTDAIHIPDFWSQKRVYLAHSFAHPPKPWIDPAKEAAAIKIALQTGQKTFKQVVAENGGDWRAQINDICDVLQYAKEKYNVNLEKVIFGEDISESLTVEPARDGKP